MNDKILRTIHKAPQEAGVYIFKAGKKFLYIGKASSLKARLNTYMHTKDMWKKKMVKVADELQLIVTESAARALILEESLIKLHKPRYNIRLMDDKKYPYIFIPYGIKFPYIAVERDTTKRGKYYGPYTSAKDLRNIINTVKQLFGIRVCRYDFKKDKVKRACLLKDINMCSAPCNDNIDEEEYNRRLRNTELFLMGKTRELEQYIERCMWEASKEENYRLALIYRNQLDALKRIRRESFVSGLDRQAADIIGFARAGRFATISQIKVREGRFFSEERYRLRIKEERLDSDIVSAFLRSVYTHVRDIPDIIYTPVAIEDKTAFVEFFKEKGRSVKILVHCPSLIEPFMRMAHRNADLSLHLESSDIPPEVLIELKKVLSLDVIPERIECVDISNIQGEYATGSLVVFKRARPAKKYYRKFKMRVIGPNDYAMIKEVLERRFFDIEELPDLIIIDGGKGQLSAAESILKKFDFDIPVFGFAKRFDILYNRDGEIQLPVYSQSLKILKQIRDEAHRFAISYHRKLRRKSIKVTILDNIPGIGEKRKTILLKEFGSISALKNASIEEISSIKGIGKHFAKRIYDYIHK